jgi:alkylmercury lyase
LKTEINPQTFDHDQLADQWVAGYSVLEREVFIRLAPHVWRELAATAQPVTPERLATLAGLPREQVVAVLREAGAEWDPEGERLVGLGVSLLRTPHRYDTDGHTVWTWCAPDLLVLPALLGQPARIQSPCAATGDPVRATVSPAGVADVEPAGAVTSIVMNGPDSLGAVRQVTCNQQNFYRDPEAAADWLATHPHGLLLPISDAFEVLRRAFQRILPAEFLS